MPAEPQSSSLAEMERRFVSSNRRSADRRAKATWRCTFGRKTITGMAAVLTVVAGGFALSRLDLSLGGEPSAVASIPSASAPLAGCPLPAEFRSDFAFAAGDAGVAPALLVAVAQQESGLDPGARSGRGAQGLLQIMPTTAQELGLDPSVRRQNVLAGARYLRRMSDRFGRLDLALAAYNAGPAAAQRGHAGAGTVAYVAEVRRRVAALPNCR